MRNLQKNVVVVSISESYVTILLQLKIAFR
jgi:hypothetical protein